MATASDLLFGLQTEYSICLEFTGLGDVYVDRYPVGGGDVKDRLTGGLLYTYGIPAQSFGVSQRSSIGSVKAAHTELAPLTDELSTEFKGEEYKVSVCGVINKGLFDPNVITFDNRLDYITGTCLGASFSENSFLFSLGDGEVYYNRPILTAIQPDGNLIIANGFEFATTSATNARDSGSIVTDVTASTLASGSQTIAIAFDTTVNDIDIRLKSASADEKLTTFKYADVSSTKVSSTGEIVSDIEISATTGTPITVTLTFTPADSMKWVIRDIDVESISNWSIAPDSVSPAYGNAVNSVHTWTGLNGVNQITFDLNKTPGDVVSISVPSDDPQTRPHIFGGSTSVKIWPVEIVEAIPLPTGISFSVSPDQSPSGSVGSYSWVNEAIASMNLSASFSNVSGSAPLVVDAENNEVTISNGLCGLTICFDKIYEYPSADADKFTYEPLVVGRPVINYEPLEKGRRYFTVSSTEYSTKIFKLGSENLNSIRNGGAGVPEVVTLSDLATNETNGTVSYYVLNADPSLIQISGEPEKITVNGFSDYPYIDGIVEQLCDIIGFDFADTFIDPEIARLQAGHYFSDRQYNLKEALDLIFAPMDVAHFFRNQKLYIQRRKTFSVTDFDTVLDASAVSDFKVGNPGDRYHKIRVYYYRNWTVQPELAGYKNEYQYIDYEINSVKYSDYPTNTVLSGSRERETKTAFMTSAGANLTAESLDRDSRINKPVSFYYESRKGEIIPNTRVQIPSSILAGSMTDGMLLVTSVQVNTDKKTQFVKGTWYAN